MFKVSYLNAICKPCLCLTHVFFLAKRLINLLHFGTAEHFCVQQGEMFSVDNMSFLAGSILGNSMDVRIGRNKILLSKFCSVFLVGCGSGSAIRIRVKSCIQIQVKTQEL
jgi:hypothetical protein